MVDVVLLQSASYVAAAIGVCIAAFYYVMTLRVQRAREGQLRMMEALNMQWSDLDDFVKKYDSSRNPELGFEGFPMGYLRIHRASIKIRDHRLRGD